MNPERQICATSHGEPKPGRDVTLSEKTRGSATDPAINLWQPRYQKSNAISWSFIPGNSSLRRDDSAQPLIKESSSPPLIIWVHSEDNNVSLESVVSNPHRDTHWLHVLLDKKLSTDGSMTLDVVLHDIRRVVILLGETYAISLSHVYLAAAGVGTGVAMQLLLMQPDGIRGIAAFQLDVASLSVAIGFDSRLRQLRAKVVTSIGASSNAHDALTFGRLLHSAGIRMTTHVYLPRDLTRTRIFLDLAEWIRRDRIELAARTHPSCSVRSEETSPHGKWRAAEASMIPSQGFETGEDFISGGHHLRPGCVVSDLRMRGMNGLALLATMRQAGSQMPFILVTAYADVPLAVDALERGAITVIEKPIRAQVLWDQIVRSLQRDYEQRLFAARHATLISRINLLSNEAKRILEMMISDIPNKTIASRMQISLRTVDHRRTEILRILQMENVKSLIWHLGEIGWTSPSTITPYLPGATMNLPFGRADLDVARS